MFACLAVCFADWPAYHGGYDLAGRADADFPARPIERWKFKADSEVLLAPVAGGEKIFIISGKGTLYALDIKGSVQWKRPPLGEEKFSGAPAYADGMLALVSRAGSVYLFDAETGEQKWKYAIENEIVQSPPNWYRNDGRLQLAVMTAPTGTAYCFDPEKGRLIRKLDETTRTDGSIATAPGLLVFGNCDSALYVFSAETGEKKGNVQIGSNGQVPAAPAVSGVLAFAGTYGEGLACVDLETMKIKWQNRDCEESIAVTPAVDESNVLFASESGTVYCADRQSGTTRWKFETNGMPAGVIVLKDKVAVTAEGRIFMLNLSDGNNLWSKEIGDEASSPSYAYGMLVVGSDDGYVRAFGGE